MKQHVVYYDRPGKTWVAFIRDEFGQLGDCTYGATRDDAVHQLGFEQGSNPQAFTRPLGQLLGDPS